MCLVVHFKKKGEIHMTLTEQLKLWYQAGEHENITTAILALPVPQRTDELMGELAVAYNNLGRYDQAILVLHELESRNRYTWRWQYRMGYALYYSALKASGSRQTLRLLEHAGESFSNALKLSPPEHIRKDYVEFLEWIKEDKKG